MASGSVGPADKRDLAANYAEGNILVFLDDDSFPSLDFLTKLSISFRRTDIKILGGPGVTPFQNTIWQKASGAAFETRWMSSDPRRYRSMAKSCLVDDWPTVNLSVIKDVFLRVGGFDSKYWPGEDTEFCLKLKNNGYKILYDPDVVVFHHRRSSLRRHLVQVGNYGLHRGFFARKYPENSRKTRYFIPSLFATYLVLSPIFTHLFGVYLTLAPITLYFLLLIYYFVNTVFNHRLLVALISIPYLVLGHISYGLRFIQGFIFKSELRSKLR